MASYNYIGKVVSLGEIMLRLTPPNYTRIEQAQEFKANYGGCEANVLVSLSHLGHKCQFISKLPNNQLGDGAIEHLQRHGIDCSCIDRGSSTLGSYFLESGFGGRPGRVIYNRKHSSFTRIESDAFDYDKIFSNASWFHFSGITLALGQRPVNVVLRCLEACNRFNVPVSFDFNYRSTLLSLEEARIIYPLVMNYVNVIFASPFDFREILCIGKDLSDEELLQLAIKKYSLDYIFTKSRKIYSSNEQSMKATVYLNDGSTISSDEQRFQIFDRIGAGDAFASGVIHALLTKKNDPKFAVDFGLCNSILKQTIFGDVATFSEEEILEFMKSQGKSEVKR